MSKVLIIGAGGVGSVVAHKCASLNDSFTDITLASRTKSQCDAIAKSVKSRTRATLQTEEIDADDDEESIFVYNICDHEVGSQGVSYTTGVPAMIGAKPMLEGTWTPQARVWNMEQNNPDPFMNALNLYGLPWTCLELSPEEAQQWIYNGNL